MKKSIFRKGLVIWVIVFLICISIISSISANISEVKDGFDDKKFKDSYKSSLDDEYYKNTLCLIKGEATACGFSSRPNQKFCCLNNIVFWGSWPTPSYGSITTIGLNGIKSIQGFFCGSLFGMYVGVVGFTGIKQKLSEEPDSNGHYKYSFTGFAFRIKLLKM